MKQYQVRCLVLCGFSKSLITNSRKLGGCLTRHPKVCVAKDTRLP